MRHFRIASHWRAPSCNAASSAESSAKRDWWNFRSRVSPVSWSPQCGSCSSVVWWQGCVGLGRATAGGRPVPHRPPRGSSQLLSTSSTDRSRSTFARMSMSGRAGSSLAPATGAMANSALASVLAEELLHDVDRQRGDDTPRVRQNREFAIAKRAVRRDAIFA